MKTLLLSIPAILLALMVFVPSAQAQILGPDTVVSADSDVFKGVPVLAYDVADSLNGGNPSTVVNGVTFSGATTQNGVSLVLTNFVDVDSNAVTQTSGMSAAYTALLVNNRFNFGSGDGSIEFTGLTPGTKYAAQIFDGTNGGAGTSFQTLSDGTSSGTLNYGPGTSASSANFIIDTFTASGTTETITFDGSNNSGVILFNAINLEAVVVPEPSTWALMFAGLGMLALFGRRYRRA